MSKRIWIGLTMPSFSEAKRLISKPGANLKEASSAAGSSLSSSARAGKVKARAAREAARRRRVARMKKMGREWLFFVIPEWEECIGRPSDAIPDRDLVRGTFADAIGDRQMARGMFAIAIPEWGLRRGTSGAALPTWGMRPCIVILSGATLGAKAARRGVEGPRARSDRAAEYGEMPVLPSGRKNLSRGPSTSLRPPFHLRSARDDGGLS